nr:BNR repeat-containing protein [Bacteroidales bacterium]
VFVSGRGKTRPGLIFRSSEPYSIAKFEKIYEGEMTYPQPWLIPGKGFIFMFTRYTNGRELYWDTGSHGISGNPPLKLAGMGGHYQVSAVHGSKLVSVFNYHPGGNVDRRTNLYAVQTNDMGRTWTSVGGKELSLPLAGSINDALVRDYESEKKLVYINDLNFDADGNPVMLAVVSRDYRPGPAGDPREWTIIRWKDGGWHFSKVCESTHNYDMGSLYIGIDEWQIIGPTEPGPQKYGTGGEIAVWKSKDQGVSWNREAMLTSGSARNHSYVRRPLMAHDDFYGFWADGDADEFSESHIYFTNRQGNKVWELPYVMKDDFARPVLRFRNGIIVK